MLVKIGPRNPSEDLVDLMLECHQRIRSFIQLAERAGRERGLPAGEVIDACQRVERYFAEALPLHVADEDHSLIPRLRGKSEAVDRALDTMHGEHLDHRPHLDELVAASRALAQAPADEARQDRLGAIAARLARDFEAHLELEEAIILPAIRATLSAEEQAAVREEMRARRQT